MDKISLMRRKFLFKSYVGDSLLISLYQRNEYFKNRRGDKSFYTPQDVLLVLIAKELSQLMPFKNVSAAINDLGNNNPNIFKLLMRNQNQCVVIERNSDETLCVGIVSAMEVKYLEWNTKKSIMVLGLKKIFHATANLFELYGIK